MDSFSFSDNVVPWLMDQGLTIAGIIVAALLIQRFSKRFITKIIRSSVRRDAFLSEKAELKREDTLIAIFSGAIKVILWLIVVLMILGELGIEVGPLLAGAGIVGVAFGFGAQYLVRDIISGFFIVFENQYRVSDVVTISGISGAVESINLRTTILRDLDGVVHHIPNGEIKVASNLTKDFAGINLDVGVGYGSDIDQVEKIVNQVGQDLANDPAWKDKITEAPAFLRVNELGDSAVVVKIVGKTQPLEQWSVTGELRRRLKAAFDQNGIEIPFPQRTIRYLNEPVA
jgi:small-conductance mechanosensitive channel